MTPAERSGLRSVLARPPYRRLWGARTVSQAGDVVQFTTLALLLYRLTGSGLGVSAGVLAEIAPVLLLAPLAGPLVDRLPRVAVMIGADVARGALAAALAIWHGDVTVVYAVAFGMSAGAVFFNPAAGSLLPGLVAESQLVAANAGIWSAAVLSQVAVAPLAGLLATSVGFGWAFAVNGASFAVSALLLRSLRGAEAPRPVAITSLWVQGRAGWSLLLRDRLLRALAVTQALAALSAGATSALLVVLAARRLQVSGTGYGFLVSAIGAGAFCGPLLLTRLGAGRPRPGVVFGAFGLRGGVDLVLATVTTLPAAAGALAAYGLGTSAGNVTFPALIQSHVGAELRGRVFAGFDLIWQAGRLSSLLLGGALTDLLGIRAVFYAGGLLLVAAALAGTAAGCVPGARATP